MHRPVVFEVVEPARADVHGVADALARVEGGVHAVDPANDRVALFRRRWRFLFRRHLAARELRFNALPGEGRPEHVRVVFEPRQIHPALLFGRAVAVDAVLLQKRPHVFPKTGFLGGNQPGGEQEGGEKAGHGGDLLLSLVDRGYSNGGATLLSPFPSALAFPVAMAGRRRARPCIEPPNGSREDAKNLECGGLTPLWAGRPAGGKSRAPGRALESGAGSPHSKYSP